MSKRLKPTGSVGSLRRLTSFMTGKPSSRDITPPSTDVLDPDAFTTPPHLIQDPQNAPSPEDALLATPSSPYAVQSQISAPKEQVLGQSGSRRQICGADLSLPIFDGKSTNSADHFIDLDTPSMETALDVRLYFWLAGDRLRGEDEDPLEHTLEQAKVYDDEVVREGRLWLKACRDRGHGYFLNPTRHLAWFNQHGNPWYRMPALGVVNDLVEGRLLGEPGEGFFQSLKGEFYDQEEEMEADGFMVTNIRMPILWSEFESPTFNQGSINWTMYIIDMYTCQNPVGRLLWEYGRQGVMDHCLAYFSEYTDLAGRDAFIAREWPTGEAESSDDEPIDILQLTGGTWKEFVGGRKPLSSRIKTTIQKIGKKK